MPNGTFSLVAQAAIKNVVFSYFPLHSRGHTVNGTCILRNLRLNMSCNRRIDEM